MNAELSTSLADTINRLHAECTGVDVRLEELLLLKINKAREVGIMLMEAKSQIPHGAFIGWVDKNIRFSRDQAALFMRFAKANVSPVIHLAEGIASLKDAMIACGALSVPAGHGEQQRSALTFLDRISIGAQKVIEMIMAKKEKQGDVTTWPEDEREAAKAQLKPLVEFYQKL